MGLSVARGSREGSLESTQVGSSEGLRVLVGFLGVIIGGMNVGILDSAVGAFVGLSEGADGISSGASVGSSESSVPVGNLVGCREGARVGITEGAEMVGFQVGSHVGAIEGERDISSVGKLDGVADGVSEGTSDGASEGPPEGGVDGTISGGSPLGVMEGSHDGIQVGLSEGVEVMGIRLGTPEGDTMIAGTSVLGGIDGWSVLSVGSTDGYTDGMFELGLPVVCEGLAEGCPDVVGSCEGARLPVGFLGLGCSVSIVGIAVGSIEGTDEIKATSGEICRFYRWSTRWQARRLPGRWSH